MTKYDTIIIGSGAGGSTVARDLSKKGHKILILEKGTFIPQGQYVKEIKTKTVELQKTLTEKEKEEYTFLNKPLELSYIENIGGTTTASIGNACFSCSGCYDNSVMTQFERNNINITKELLEISEEINVKYFPNEQWGPATKKLAEAGRELNYEIEAMPKFINFDKCTNCGMCVNGCIKDGKWDATYFIKEAKENNAEIITNFTVNKILKENGKVKGVEGINENGDIEVFYSDIVVLSAGALNTPLILRNSGIENAGEEIFLDIFTTIGGYLPNSNLKNELLMGIKAEFGPYFLSPHYSTQLLPLIKEKGYDVSDKDITGLMLKFADENTGKINDDGSISKTLTVKDLEIIKEGYKKAWDLLVKIGVDSDSIVATGLKGAHPGGTAPLGKIVDEDFQTSIEGLFVCDASVIPEAPGRPPILTILGISRKVSNFILGILE